MICPSARTASGLLLSVGRRSQVARNPSPGPRLRPKPADRPTISLFSIGNEFSLIAVLCSVSSDIPVAEARWKRRRTNDDDDSEDPLLHLPRPCPPAAAHPPPYVHSSFLIFRCPGCGNASLTIRGSVGGGGGGGGGRVGFHFSMSPTLLYSDSLKEQDSGNQQTILCTFSHGCREWKWILSVRLALGSMHFSASFFLPEAHATSAGLVASLPPSSTRSFFIRDKVTLQLVTILLCPLFWYSKNS